MRIRIRDLRAVIREELLRETGGGTSLGFFMRGSDVPDGEDKFDADVETERHPSLDQKDDEDLPPHLRTGPGHEELTDLGPVPPVDDENDPHAMLDPYHDDWHVLPTPRFSR